MQNLYVCRSAIILSLPSNFECCETYQKFINFEQSNFLFLRMTIVCPLYSNLCVSKILKILLLFSEMFTLLYYSIDYKSR